MKSGQIYQSDLEAMETGKLTKLIPCESIMFTIDAAHWFEVRMEGKLLAVRLVTHGKSNTIAIHPRVSNDIRIEAVPA